MYTRGKYGVEFSRPIETDSRRRSTPKWGVMAVLVALVITSAFVASRVRRSQTQGDLKPKVSLLQVQPAKVVPAIPATPTPPPAVTTNKVVNLPKLGPRVDEFKLDTRPPQDRLLLEKYIAATQQGRRLVAIEALEQLLQRGTAVDISDKLARRLGELNFAWMMEDTNTPWTVTRTVRRGDALIRIAREYGTTVSALERLNGLARSAPLGLGKQLKVMNFPKATLTVRLRLHTADLVLNGRFFKRYYVSSRKDARPGPSQVTREKSARQLLTELGLRAAPNDLAELEMFLSPGAYVIVAE